MEAVIYNDLIRRGYHVNVGVVPVTEKNEEGNRTTTQYEVDFIATMGDKKIYIQSAYNIYDEEKRKQETNSFLKIKDSFKKIMVEGDLYLPYTDKYGIEHIGVIDFLLNEKIG